MISPKPQLNLKNAREYFRRHLSASDYYSQQHSLAGQWFGQGATALQLSGLVSEKAFLALCDGLHPQNGKRLTARRNTVRRAEGALKANRRLYYDYTISPPKSVSTLALMHDPRIVDAHQRAVRSALTELEKFAQTRIRIGQSEGDRSTGNIVVACFQHETSRELDPHLHTHCIVFNATFDPVENRWKALQTHGMLTAQKFASSLYDHELCRELHQLGYRTRPSPKAFEIEGVPQTVIQRFSKRTQQIDAEAALLLQKGAGANLAEIRDQVAHGKRRRKTGEDSAARCLPAWKRQLSDHERLCLAMTANPVPRTIRPANPVELVSWAQRHVFERNCVVPTHHLVSAALTYGRGLDFKIADVRLALNESPAVFEVEGNQTGSRDLAELEGDLLRLARQRSRTEAAIHVGYIPNPELKPEQVRAVARILESHSLITLFRGRAGTGKSRTLREVYGGIGAAGLPAVVLAPQRQQAIDLESEGMPALTLAQFLHGPDPAPRTVVLLDEASQVGIRDLHALATRVRSASGRLILSGDSRQHGAVAASDALILLERFAGLPVAKLSTIRRQDPRLAESRPERRQILAYRAAVKLAASGQVMPAFDRLDALGWIQQGPAAEIREMVAAAFMASQSTGQRVLAVTQTWVEVDAVNQAIRSALTASGLLSQPREIISFRTVDLTRAQKQAPATYAEGQPIHFLRSYGRYRRGDFCRIAAVNPDGLVLERGGRQTHFSLSYGERIALLEERPVEVAIGDQLQLKFNGTCELGQRLVNGEIVTVCALDVKHGIEVEDLRGTRKRLGFEHRIFNHGYAVTSYASQGKTVDTVLFCDSGSKLATNAKQWFVTISRGRKRVLIFTPDKAGLRMAIQRDGHRMLATEAKKLLQRRERNIAALVLPVIAPGNGLAPATKLGAQGVI